MNVASPDDAWLDDCEHVLERVYEFLDNELDAATGDAIRHHLAMCEPCLERFDIEEAVKSLVHRRCGGEVAPTQLRAKIVYQMTVIRKTL
ncbi:MAG TPA: mycothiol system anti-sigma-R factor [Propionibacteriaceae bacterium]|jgi:mycothiol system anti-sigma-R factor|nr:mycothiol system anti-sigma-R factor [Propionibacteriaceae bacterium]